MSKLVPRWFWYVSVAWLALRSGLVMQFFTSNPSAFRLAKLGALMLDVSVTVGLVMIAAHLYLRAKKRRAGGKLGNYHYVQEFEPITVSMPPTNGNKLVVSRPCPNCETSIEASALVCFYCHSTSEPWFQQQGRWWKHTGTGDVYLDETSGQWRHPEQV